MFSLIGGAGYPLGSEVTSSTTTADLEKRKEMFGFIFFAAVTSAAKIC